MKLGIVLNWRQALLTTLRVLVIFTPNSSQCEAGLWIEQGRYPPVSYHIIKVKTQKSNWLVRLQGLLSYWQVSGKIFVNIFGNFLGSCLLLWLNLLGWLIEKSITVQTMSMQCSRFPPFTFRCHFRNSGSLSFCVVPISSSSN